MRTIIVAGLLACLLAAPARGALQCTPDMQGADDEPGQKDLTEFCRDDMGAAPPYDFLVSWNWDQDSWSGNNTGDACALFDTDGDQKANFALCVTVGGKPAAATSVREYSCGNDRPDRCTNSVQIASFSSTCEAMAMPNINPFDMGTDTMAMCSVALADFGGASTAVLTDACSYPSQQPNSDPSDCVIDSTQKDPCLGVNCDDGNPCTADGCDASSGQAVCVHVAGGQDAVCRPSAGPCDVEEKCTGASTTCPPDGFADNSTVCRQSAGVCDVEEKCTGTGAQCPSDQKSTAVCRPAAGSCDVPESCDGISNDCPPDALANAGTVCRASGGVCDPQEVCTGTDPDCPADQKSTDVCRPAAGPCDVAESCNGSSNDCPQDGFAPSSTVCRPSAGACDLQEACTGSSAQCPADQKSTAVCRPAAGACDVAESCDGTSNTCPPDGFSPSSTICRAAAGVCDVAEHCSGSAAQCPADQKSTAVCRPSAGPCDVAESCNGTSNDCPPDGFSPSSTICRAAAGVCDVADHCSGSAAQCPPDQKSTAVCRPAAGPCDVPESCNGTSNDCPADRIAGAGTLCRPAMVECDVPEYCNGTSTACPPNAYKPSGTPCADDHNDCTYDFCDGKGYCSHPPNDAHSCNDFDPCTSDETCVDGECVGTQVCEPTCRTAGFWGTHGGDELRGSRTNSVQNITGALIDAAGDNVMVCGQVINRSIPIGDLGSALEGLCVSVGGEQVRQLYRQLVAFRLNCILSGETANCDVLLPTASACDALCAGGTPPGVTVEDCISQLDCFNNGGRYVPGKGCALGECAADDWLFCGGDFGSCPDVCTATDPVTHVCTTTAPEACLPFDDSCHERNLCPADTNGDSIPDGNGFCFEPVAGASSNRACHRAEQNDCTIDGCQGSLSARARRRARRAAIRAARLLARETAAK